MRNLMKQKIAGWMGGGLVLILFAAAVVSNLQGTGAQPMDLAHIRADATQVTTTTVPVPTSGTPFDNPHLPDDRPSVNAHASPVAINTSDSLYAALYSMDPEQRLSALDSIWQSAEMFYKLENIVRRIDELVADADPRIAELAPLVLAQVMELRGMQDALMDPNQDAYVATSPTPQEGTSARAEPHRTNFNADSNDGAQTEQEYFAQLSARALYNDDASVRMQAIEEAQIQRDERSIAMLSQATQDTNSDNRLAAVEGLRQMLEEGFGEAAQITGVLQQISRDPDPKVAEAAQQAIRTE